ncbi:MAG: DUF1549 domain-containing protein, partial [Armatimonadetes bacterium]|nr:DUF1549 domain-containing protein [Armatimonadota bacterium]
MEIQPAPAACSTTAGRLPPSRASRPGRRGYQPALRASQGDPGVDLGATPAAGGAIPCCGTCGLRRLHGSAVSRSPLPERGEAPRRSEPDRVLELPRGAGATSGWSVSGEINPERAAPPYRQLPGFSRVEKGVNWPNFLNRLLRCAAPGCVRSRPRLRAAAALAVTGVLVLPALAAPPARQNSSTPGLFEKRVLPLLQKHCYGCHSHAGQIRGGLALDSRSGWERGGEHGPAIRPGDREGSLLLQAIRYRKPGLQMPPGGRLPAAEIALLEQWVQEGAPDPRVGAGPRPAAGGVDLQKGRQFWAFQPIRDPSPPSVRDASWPRSPVDRFLLAKLEQAGLRPATDADRYTWLRRVSLDLTGLPPSPAEIQAFLAVSGPLAEEEVVDRLLGSPAFGERWARHWLDLTGYADQIGTSNDVFAEHAWRYRDYLIRSYNADKPYDRFLREQIAGDLLPYRTPEERADSLTATGFLVLGDVEIVNPDKLKLETDLVDQQVSKVGQAFMAMTVGCARCHDHKFDPIGQADYYALAGIFKSTRSTLKIPYGIWSGIETVELPETEAQRAARKQREQEHRVRIERLRAEQARTKQQQDEVVAQLAASPADREALTGRRDELAARSRRLAGKLEHAVFFQPVPPRAFAVREAERPGDMKICIRGNPYALGATVPRGYLRVASWGASPAIPAGQSGRRQLADWLADPRHPLTARVAVNRVWQKLFGEGLVRSVDYFGERGDRPSHPELLDYLATRLLRNGWSQKQLIRGLVLSRAYRMSSTAGSEAGRRDPENRLFSRMQRQRLDAEALRDSLLFASGQLQPGAGGPGLPLEYVENTGLLQPTGVNPPTFRFTRFRPGQEFQRTVYLPVIRASQPLPSRLRDVFDFTQPAQMAGKRSQTIVPTQALFLMNSDLVRKRATALA